MIIKSVVFDMDGTLVRHPNNNTDPLLAGFCQDNGIATWDVEKLRKNYMHPDKVDLGFGMPIKDQATFLLRYYKYAGENFKKHPEIWPVTFEGVPALLEEMKTAGMNLYLATARERESTNIILEHNRIDAYFEKRVTTTCVEGRGQSTKPSSDMLFYLQQVHHAAIDNKNSIVVGDTLHDIRMAQGMKPAPIPVVAVSYGTGELDDLQKASPTHIVHTVAELRQYILGL